MLPWSHSQPQATTTGLPHASEGAGELIVAGGGGIDDPDSGGAAAAAAGDGDGFIAESLRISAA